MQNLNGQPYDSSFEHGIWNAGITAKHISDTFGVSYSQRPALMLTRRLWFSVRRPRPIPYNKAAPKEQANLIKEGRTTVARWRVEGRAVMLADAVIMRG